MRWLKRTQVLFVEIPHTARRTSNKFEELDGVEILPRPAYSPDIASSDYGLFRSMQHLMKGHRFESFDEVEEACQKLFNSKPKASRSLAEGREQ